MVRPLARVAMAHFNSAGSGKVNILSVMQTSKICLLVLTLLSTVSIANARGRMIEPCQRSSLWRRGYNSPVNTDDGGLNCGGYWHQWQVNKGKCGVCGDPWESNPHPNEQGGKFSNGIIARTYHNDDTHINIAIEVEKNKNGYFEFRLCPEVSDKNPVTQECLDRFPLDIEGQGKRFYPQSSGTVYLRVAMPKGVLCERCVLQWKWHTALHWGKCKDGSSKVGCGDQTEIYNCADIAILPAGQNSQQSNIVNASENPEIFHNSQTTDARLDTSSSTNNNRRVKRNVISSSTGGGRTVTSVKTVRTVTSGETQGTPLVPSSSGGRTVTKTVKTVTRKIVNDHQAAPVIRKSSVSTSSSTMPIQMNAGSASSSSSSTMTSSVNKDISASSSTTTSESSKSANIVKTSATKSPAISKESIAVKTVEIKSKTPDVTVSKSQTQTDAKTTESKTKNINVRTMITEKQSTPEFVEIIPSQQQFGGNVVFDSSVNDFTGGSLLSPHVTDMGVGNMADPGFMYDQTLAQFGGHMQQPQFVTMDPLSYYNANLNLAGMSMFDSGIVSETQQQQQGGFVDTTGQLSTWVEQTTESPQLQTVQSQSSTNTKTSTTVKETVISTGQKEKETVAAQTSSTQDQLVTVDKSTVNQVASVDQGTAATKHTLVEKTAVEMIPQQQLPPTTTEATWIQTNPHTIGHSWVTVAPSQKLLTQPVMLQGSVNVNSGWHQQAMLSDPSMWTSGSQTTVGYDIFNQYNTNAAQMGGWAEIPFSTIAPLTTTEATPITLAPTEKKVDVQLSVETVPSTSSTSSVVKEVIQQKATSAVDKTVTEEVAATTVQKAATKEVAATTVQKATTKEVVAATDIQTNVQKVPISTDVKTSVQAVDVSADTKTVVQEVPASTNVKTSVQAMEVSADTKTIVNEVPTSTDVKVNVQTVDTSADTKTIVHEVPALSDVKTSVKTVDTKTIVHGVPAVTDVKTSVQTVDTSANAKTIVHEVPALMAVKTSVQTVDTSADTKTIVHEVPAVTDVKTSVQTVDTSADTKTIVHQVPASTNINTSVQKVTSTVVANDKAAIISKPQPVMQVMVTQRPVIGAVIETLPPRVPGTVIEQLQPQTVNHVVTQTKSVDVSSTQGKLVDQTVLGTKTIDNSAKIETIVNKAVVPTTNIDKTVPVGGGTITTVDKTVTMKGGKVTRIDKTVIVEKIKPKMINVRQPEVVPVVATQPKEVVNVVATQPKEVVNVVATQPKEVVNVVATQPKEVVHAVPTLPPTTIKVSTPEKTSATKTTIVKTATRKAVAVAPKQPIVFKAGKTVVVKSGTTDKKLDTSKLVQTVVRQGKDSAQGIESEIRASMKEQTGQTQSVSGQQTDPQALLANMFQVLSEIMVKVKGQTPQKMAVDTRRTQVDRIQQNIVAKTQSRITTPPTYRESKQVQVVDIVQQPQVQAPVITTVKPIPTTVPTTVKTTPKPTTKATTTTPKPTTTTTTPTTTTTTPTTTTEPTTTVPPVVDAIGGPSMSFFNAMYNPVTTPKQSLWNEAPATTASPLMWMDTVQSSSSMMNSQSVADMMNSQSMGSMMNTGAATIDAQTAAMMSAQNAAAMMNAMNAMQNTAVNTLGVQNTALNTQNTATNTVDVQNTATNTFDVQNAAMNILNAQNTAMNTVNVQNTAVDTQNTAIVDTQSTVDTSAVHTAGSTMTDQQIIEIMNAQNAAAATNTNTGTSTNIQTSQQSSSQTVTAAKAPSVQTIVEQSQTSATAGAPNPWDIAAGGMTNVNWDAMGTLTATETKTATSNSKPMTGMDALLQIMKSQGLIQTAVQPTAPPPTTPPTTTTPLPTTTTIPTTTTPPAPTPPPIIYHASELTPRHVDPISRAVMLKMVRSMAPTRQDLFTVLYTTGPDLLNSMGINPKHVRGSVHTALMNVMPELRRFLGLPPPRRRQRQYNQYQQTATTSHTQYQQPAATAGQTQYQQTASTAAQTQYSQTASTGTAGQHQQTGYNAQQGQYAVTQPQASMQGAAQSYRAPRPTVDPIQRAMEAAMTKQVLQMLGLVPEPPDVPPGGRRGGGGGRYGGRYGGMGRSPYDPLDPGAPVDPYAQPYGGGGGAPHDPWRPQRRPAMTPEWAGVLGIGPEPGDAPPGGAGGAGAGGARGGGRMGGRRGRGRLAMMDQMIEMMGL